MKYYVTVNAIRFFIQYKPTTTTISWAYIIVAIKVQKHNDYMFGDGKEITE